MPATRPSTLTSTPSTQPTVTPSSPAERKLHPRAAGGEAEDVRIDPPVLAHGSRRQGDAGLGDGGEHIGDERVGVGSRPDRVIAAVVVGIAGDGRTDLGDQCLGRRPLDRADEDGAMPVPARIRRPVVGLDRPPPGDLVVAGIAAGALVLDHDPAVVREDALPAPRACRRRRAPAPRAWRAGPGGCWRSTSRPGSRRWRHRWRATRPHAKPAASRTRPGM